MAWSGVPYDNVIKIYNNNISMSQQDIIVTMLTLIFSDTSPRSSSVFRPQELQQHGQQLHRVERVLEPSVASVVCLRMR